MYDAKKALVNVYVCACFGAPEVQTTIQCHLSWVRSQRAAGYSLNCDCTSSRRYSNAYASLLIHALYSLIAQAIDSLIPLRRLMVWSWLIKKVIIRFGWFICVITFHGLITYLLARGLDASPRRRRFPLMLG